MSTHDATRPYAAGVIGLETTGVADRSIAMDILHALIESHDLCCAFHHDMSFDPPERIWRPIETTPDLDLLLVALRPGAAVLLNRLNQALATRASLRLGSPLVVFGGTTHYTAEGQVSAAPALTWSGDAEAGWPRILDRLAQHAPQLRSTIRKTTLSPFAMPAQHSTARSVQAGGTVWVEASRSCPLHCSFCVLSTPALDTTWRPRPIAHLLDEIAYLIDTYDVTDVSFSDYSAFETDAYVEQFLTGVRDRGLDFTFRCDMRLSTARRLSHRLPELYTAGLRAVYVGIESLVGRQRAIYGKGYPGKTVIDLLRAQGIFVAAGFITLDPMSTPDEFRQQVLGITEQGLLDSIATPFKTMRIQRHTSYEQQARKLGIVGELNPDGYTYAYRCADDRLEIIRKVIEFFHGTTKDVYYNPYIENNIRERRDVEDWQRQTFRQITRRYKNAQIDFLEELASIATTNDSVTIVTDLVHRAAERFSATRHAIFRRTAQDYDHLLSRGTRHYRSDVINFINQWRSVPSFDSDVLRTDTS
ncbi:MAG: B12-binding domain-containing radical SAM protein [Pseudonocardiaceae bacterium]